MQRELLACDAEEPLETWRKKKPWAEALWLLLPLNKKQNKLLGVFTNFNVLCTTKP